MLYHFEKVCDSETGPSYVVVHQLRWQISVTRRWRHTLMVKRASDFSLLFHEKNLMQTKQSKFTFQVDVVQITSFNSISNSFLKCNTKTCPIKIWAWIFVDIPPKTCFDKLCPALKFLRKKRILLRDLLFSLTLSRTTLNGWNRLENNADQRWNRSWLT